MSSNRMLKHALRSSLVAIFLVCPAVGWANPVSDRPLFLDAAVDHNLMFVVDDSGSMDWEVLVPGTDDYPEAINGYLFDTGVEKLLKHWSGDYLKHGKYKTGKKIYDTTQDFGGPQYTMVKPEYYLYSPDYNLQYYDPSEDYKPWGDGESETYSDQKINEARWEPGFNNSEASDLTEVGELGLQGNAIPATVFLKTQEGSVEEFDEGETVYDDCPDGWRVSKFDKGVCIKGFGLLQREPRPTKKLPDTVENTFSCSTGSDNWYHSWHSDPSSYRFKNKNGTVLSESARGFGPDGACLARVELLQKNKTEIEKLTGDSVEYHQTNFANWFSYYRRRHQAIRGAVSQAVDGLENIRLGVMGFDGNTRFEMKDRMYDVGYNQDADIKGFRSNLYDLFLSGNYGANSTPIRAALYHAGQQYSKAEVRGPLECRKNFTLVFTDGAANKNTDFKKNTYSGNSDEYLKAPFGDSENNGTLSDVAYKFYKELTDFDSNNPGALRVPDECSGDSPPPWMDCNTKHHMNTFAVSLGMLGEKYAGKKYFKVGDAHKDAAKDKNEPNWSSIDMNPRDTVSNANEGPEQIDDLFHAAVNGKGEYYSTRSTTELVGSLKAAVNDMQRQLGSGTNANFNTTALEEGSFVYSAQFVSQAWTGSIRANALDENGKIGSLEWDAAVQLNNRDLNENPRLILTANDNGKGVEFDWGESGAEVESLRTDLRAGGSVALGKARMDYIKGDLLKSGEGVAFRERASRLGAIVNSSPVFVGEPDKIWPDSVPFNSGSAPYSDFKSSKENRDHAVYVGANDGMLHGFDAKTGDEILGYIPSFLYSGDKDKGLSALTDPVGDYQSYVDLPLNTTDVYVNGKWRSIVIGGSRGNTPGIFALDVTDPTDFSKQNADKTVMWEFSGDENLGHLTEAVQVSLLKWGDGDYRWSAVFSNGYGAPSEKNGLFVVDIGKPSNYKFIELSSGKGLSPVRLADYVDTNGAANSDGVADRAYAGDLKGRLWVIDLTGGKSEWKSAYGEWPNAEPMFVAKDKNGKTQPITAQPEVTRKKGQGEPNLLVFFGTGKYLLAEDIPTNPMASQVQSFYGISDSSSKFSRSDLLPRTIITGTVDGVAVRKTEETGGALDWATDYGWYMDFPEGGERVVAGAMVRGEFVVFPSIVPDGTNPCGGGGVSYLTALQLDGLVDPSKAIIDVNNDDELDEKDAGWAGVAYGDGIINNIALIEDVVVTSDSGAKKGSFLTEFGAGKKQTKRIGWHELIAQ